MPDFFPYRDGELYAEAVPVARIAAAVGTPFYLYSAAALTACYRAFAEAFAPARPLICYAVKANSNLAVLRVFARLGAGADVVSEGELRRALAAGIPPQRIIFSGVGKTRGELECRARRRHPPDQRRVGARTAPAQRDRGGERQDRPGRDPRQSRCRRPHPHQDLDRPQGRQIRHRLSATRSPAYRLAADLPGIEPVGLAVHIGSQIVDLAPEPRGLRAACRAGRRVARPSGWRCGSSISAAG